LTSHRRSRRALFATAAAVAAAAIAPAAAGAAPGITVTGDDGNPVALAGALNIRNMSPVLAITAAPTDHWSLSVTGPNGAVVAPDTGCISVSPSPTHVDYVGNGVYTVTVTNYAGGCGGAATTQMLAFTITASTTITGPPTAQLTRLPGSPLINTVKLPIDLNPGALATDAFVAVNVVPNADGSLPGAPTQLSPDPTARTVGVPLDKGPGMYVVAARARAFPGTNNPQAFGPWATPAAIRAFGPFDLRSFRWTDSRGPSYRFSATIAETSATGSVNVAIGRGTKGSYRSFGSAKIRRHAFAKRFRLTRGKWRIRLKYKGNATVAPGFEVRRFEITRTTFFRGAASRSSAVG
jgi:hypothetical protein